MSFFQGSKLYFNGKKQQRKPGYIEWDNSPFQMRIRQMRMTYYTHPSTFYTHTHMHTQSSV